jgi:serine/threonine protein kinase
MNLPQNNKFPKFDPVSLDYVKKIGHGSCSTVWKIQDKDSNHFYSLKIIQISKLSEKLSDLTSMLRKVQNFSHEKLLTHYFFFLDTQNIYQINELFEGRPLFEKLFSEKSFREPEAFSYFFQILEALEYLDSKNSVHGDVRLENVLLGKSGTVKLSIFGCGNFLTRGLKKKTQDFSDLGVLLYEMLTGCGSLEQDQRKKFFEDFRVERIRVHLSSECKDFLSVLLRSDEKLEYSDLKLHPWILAKGTCKVFENENEKFCMEDLDAEKYEKNTGFACRDSNFSTTFTELAQTRESCIENVEFLEAENEKLTGLEGKVRSLHEELEEKKVKEIFLRGQLEAAEFELNHLVSIDTSQDILNRLNEAQKELMEKTRLCTKQKIYLTKLKRITEEKSKDIELKEIQRKELLESVKSINLGILKIKTHRSLDLSTLKIDLDVLQYKIGEKSPLNSGFSLPDLKDFVETRTNSIKFLSKSDYKQKICKCLSLVSEFQQKIADLSLNFELEKGKIIQTANRIKEKFEKIKKAKQEERKTLKTREFSLKKQDLLKELSKIPKILPISEALESAKLRFTILKSSLSALNNQIKKKRKEKFILESKIDSGQLEMDEIRTKLNRKNSLRINNKFF